LDCYLGVRRTKNIPHTLHSKTAARRDTRVAGNECALWDST